MTKVILKRGKQVRYQIKCDKCDTQFTYESQDIIETSTKLYPAFQVTKAVSCPVCSRDLLADLGNVYNPVPPPTTEYACRTKD